MGALHTYVAGERIAPAPGSTTIRTIDGQHALVVCETSAVQLRRALRHAEECQGRVERTTLDQRLEIARLLLTEYARRADEACWALANFRGITSADTRWMCQVNLRWAEDLNDLVDVMWGHARRPSGSSQPERGVYFHSKGQAALFSSATMDGPPALVLICHAILSGTHLIMKPSFRDAATHLAFETLYTHGLSEWAQLVRWRSESQEAAQLNRALINQVPQAVIFSSNESYRAVLDGAARPGSEEWDALRTRVKRYGTGLPLGMVTREADLESAARDLTEGARLGGGRFCLSVCPVLVERSVHDALCERIVACARTFRDGPLLAPDTQLSAHDPADAPALRDALKSFGGSLQAGAIREASMDLAVLANVPTSTPALFRELPGTALALIPVDDLEQGLSIAVSSLRHNQRSAWTALVFFGAEREFARVLQRVPSFRYLRGGVVAQVKLLLPHQGEYFALDLMRRITVE